VLITSGDPGGVGPELVLRALADPGTSGLAEFTAVGNPADFERAAAALALPLPRIHPAGGPGGGLDGAPRPAPVGQPSAAGGRAAVTAVREAARLVAAGDADALVTAPVSKEALRLAGYPWPGQTEMLADLCAASDLRVLLMAGPLRVVHVSAHRSLREAIEAVTEASVLRTIELADGVGRRLLGRPPRVAVAGLNPHASESGAFGVLYVGLSLTAAVVETLLRNPARKMVAYREVAARASSNVRSNRDLNLVRLYGSGLQQVGCDNAISTGPYEPCGAWADVLWAHPQRPDGAAFQSRHDSREICVALFERSDLDLNAEPPTPLIDQLPTIANLLSVYRKSITL